MTNAGLKTTRNDWIRRIIFLLRDAEIWQLRELYYVAAGYLNASRMEVGDHGTGAVGGAALRSRFDNAAKNVPKLDTNFS